MIGRDAPAPVRAAWEGAYEEAVDYYEAQAAPSPDNLARNTAWKTVKLFWSEPRKGQYRERNPNDRVIAGTYRGEVIHVGQTRPLPEPGKTAGLCKLLELTWIAHDGTLQVQRFQEPGLPEVFWNKKTQILYVFPMLELGEGVCKVPKERGGSRILRNLLAPFQGNDDTFIGLEDQVKMYRLWAKRDPQCRYNLTVPSEPIVAYGVADTIVYRSDKWEKDKWPDGVNPHPDKRGSQEYLHQYGLDVAIEETPGDPPPSIVMRGGKLTVMEGGIAH